MRISNQWPIVFVSSAAFFMSYFGRMMWSVLNAYSSLKPTVGDTGLIFSLFFVGYILIQIPAALLMDRIRPNILTGAALIALAACLFAGGIAWSMVVEYAVSVAMGVSAGWIYPGTLKIMTMLFPDRDKRTVAIGYYSLSWPLSVILLGLVLPPIALAFGWRWGYYAMAAVSLILGLLVLDSKLANFKRQKFSLSFLVNKNSIIIALAGFTFYFAYWPITFFAYNYFLSIGLGDYGAGIALSALAVAGIPSTLISGFVMNRLGIRRTALFSLVIYGALVLVLPSVNTLYPVVIIALAMGFFRFFITPANSAIISVVGEDHAGSLSSFANIFWQASGVVAPIISAYLISGFGFIDYWYAMGAMVLLSCVFYVAIRLPPRSRLLKIE